MAAFQAALAGLGGSSDREVERRSVVDSAFRADPAAERGHTADGGELSRAISRDD
jgi:hypothetical protein